MTQPIQTPVAAPVPSLDDLSFPEVSRYREMLKSVPGNEEFDRLWDWKNAKPSEKGVVIPPAITGAPELTLVPEGRRDVLGDDIAGNYVDGRITIRPDWRTSGPDYFNNLKALGVEFIASKSPQTSAAYEESRLLHEMVHHVSGPDRFLERIQQPRETAPFAGDEYAAFRAQYDMLERAGIVKHVSTGTILNHLTLYAPGTYAHETLSAFNGQFTEEMRPYLPGGSEFVRIMKHHAEQTIANGRQPTELARDAMSSDVWNTEYGKAYMKGIHSYFLFSRRAELIKGGGDTAESVEAAIDYAGQKLAEFRKFAGLRAE